MFAHSFLPTGQRLCRVILDINTVDEAHVKNGPAVQIRFAVVCGVSSVLSLAGSLAGCEPRDFSDKGSGVRKACARRAQGVRSYVVASDTANVRADSNTSGDILTAFPKGKAFAVEGRKVGWYKVWFGGKLGFISPVTLEEPWMSAK